MVTTWQYLQLPRRLWLSPPELNPMVMLGLERRHESYTTHMVEFLRKDCCLSDVQVRRVLYENALEFAGMRPGEKLFEELCHREEELAPTSHPKILVYKNR